MVARWERRGPPRHCRLPRPGRCLCALIPCSVMLVGAPLLAPTLDTHYQRASAPSKFPSTGMRSSSRDSPPVPPIAVIAPSPPMGIELDLAYPPRAFNWDGAALPEWLARKRQALLVESDSAHKLPQVPRAIHQTWKDRAPPKQLFSARWRNSLVKVNPGWQYRLWTDAENRALVAERYPEHLRMYDGYTTAIQRSDAARYFIAHAHGACRSPLF